MVCLGGEKCIASRSRLQHVTGISWQESYIRFVSTQVGVKMKQIYCFFEQCKTMFGRVGASIFQQGMEVLGQQLKLLYYTRQSGRIALLSCIGLSIASFFSWQIGGSFLPGMGSIGFLMHKGKLLLNGTSSLFKWALLGTSCVTQLSTVGWEYFKQGITSVWPSHQRIGNYLVTSSTELLQNQSRTLPVQEAPTRASSLPNAAPQREGANLPENPPAISWLGWIVLHGISLACSLTSYLATQYLLERSYPGRYPMLKQAISLITLPITYFIVHRLLKKYFFSEQTTAQLTQEDKVKEPPMDPHEIKRKREKSKREALNNALWGIAFFCLFGALSRLDDQEAQKENDEPIFEGTGKKNKPIKKPLIQSFSLLGQTSAFVPNHWENYLDQLERNLVYGYNTLAPYMGSRAYVHQERYALDPVPKEAFERFMQTPELSERASYYLIQIKEPFLEGIFASTNKLNITQQQHVLSLWREIIELLLPYLAQQLGHLDDDEKKKKWKKYLQQEARKWGKRITQHKQAYDLSTLIQKLESSYSSPEEDGLSSRLHQEPEVTSLETIEEEDLNLLNNNRSREGTPLTSSLVTCIMGMGLTIPNVPSKGAIPSEQTQCLERASSVSPLPKNIFNQLEKLQKREAVPQETQSTGRAKSCPPLVNLSSPDTREMDLIKVPIRQEQIAWQKEGSLSPPLITEPFLKKEKPHENNRQAEGALLEEDMMHLIIPDGVFTHYFTGRVKTPTPLWAPCSLSSGYSRRVTMRPLVHSLQAVYPGYAFEVLKQRGWAISFG